LINFFRFSDSLLHLYTHERCWPEISDLSTCLNTHINILATESGGNPFDEAFFCPWVAFQDKWKDLFPIEMACHSATVELRGQLDVNDAFASEDAERIYRFLVGRGFIQGDLSSSSSTDTVKIPNELKVVPLTGVDMMEATVPGLIVWKTAVGENVKKDQLIAEIVDIEDVDASRTPVIARIDGFIYGRALNKLAVPGDIIVEIAGEEKLDWRSGNLLFP
jgi:predicted deacylase